MGSRYERKQPMTGKVLSIHIAACGTSDMTEISEATLVAGRGIVGDRYHAETGTFSEQLEGPDHELTLIAAEEIARFCDSTGQTLGAGELRRNVVTQGIELNDLVGKEFTLGEVRARGMRLCEPCSHLAALVSPDVLPALVHRAGLRVAILEGGTVRPGDTVAAISAT